MNYFPKNIPITILTGFLGSGKTTLLSALLKQENMKKIAVIINEFGEVGIDHDLIETTDENVVELQNGCICCTIQEDLKKTLTNLLIKMQNNEISLFNRVIIETTGLADPVPIIQTLITSLDLYRIYSIDGIVTVVDCVNGEITYNNHQESIKQTALANKVILSKTDLTNKSSIKSIMDRIKTINPKAVISKSRINKPPIEELIELNDYDPLNKFWKVDKWLAFEKYRNNNNKQTINHYNVDINKHQHGHNKNLHGDNVRSFALLTDERISVTVLNFFLEIVSSQIGSNLLRLKGIINIKGEERPAVIHAVQHVLHPIEWLEKWPDEDRNTKLVFITQNIKKSVIENFFKIIGKNKIHLN